MPIRINHDEIEQFLRRAGAVFEETRDTDRHVDTPGLDPAVNSALAADDEEESELGRQGVDDIEVTRRGSREMEEAGDAAAGELDGEGRDEGPRTSGAPNLFDTSADTGGNPYATPGLPSGMAPGGVSAATYNPDIGMYGSTMPMSQYAPTVDYAAYTPTPAMATQYDVNHAPNRDELREAIYQAVRGGGYNSGEDGDTRPRAGGGSRRGGEGDTELEQRFIDAMDSYVQAGIPYAWGGGHGPTPGISGGISDGGGHADAMGDYNKQGLDCSGFVRAVHYDATGSDDLHGTAAMQYDMTEPVHPDDARPGDLYFPDSAGRPPAHVQVYAGGDQVAEAQQSGTDIMYSDLQPGEFRRVPGY